MSWRSKNEDRLSSLPEEILSHILSLMPTSFAVRTSILSKRWKHCWRMITNLDLNDYYLVYNLKCFSKYVDRVLEHCKASQLKSFKLGLFRTSVQKSDVAKWINEAIRLNVCELDIHLPKFPNLKHLELKGSFKSPWILVTQILESSPELEHLCFEELEDNSWIEPESVPTCMVSNLRTMKITKCKGRKCDIQFLEYILGNSEVLKTITIICGSMRMKDEMEMYARLLKFPRASRFCGIHFVGKWLSSIGK
ncbi:unnamed protein product [Lactuca saligna]|uniref:F-box domain-containing protein n=1 Tax=Lactuca saligna TaxID=75948 RepID=A0AA35Y5M5_LACSI|nr:unnamed protein product [Lactuca saligna]